METFLLEQRQRETLFMSLTETFAYDVGTGTNKNSNKLFNYTLAKYQLRTLLRF